MTIWKNNFKRPDEGDKIEVVLKGKKDPEITVWVDGKPYHEEIKWEDVIIWRVIEKDYLPILKTRNLISEKAEQVAEILGWQLQNKWRTPRLLKYPYAISFSRDRKLLNVRMVDHPDFEESKNIGQMGVRIVLNPNLPAERIANEIRDRLFDKIEKYTNEAYKDQIKWKLP